MKARDLVFLDEFGANTQMQRTHGRAAPGQRVVAAVPHRHYKNMSTVAAMTAAGIVASTTYDGGTNAARFVGFVRDHLVPALRPGQVVVLDNLSAHHNKEARALVEAAGCRLVHLPAYSPDLKCDRKGVCQGEVDPAQAGEANRAGPTGRDPDGAGRGHRCRRDRLHRAQRVRYGVVGTALAGGWASARPPYITGYHQAWQ